MGCQKEIAKKIIGKGADYVLALKGNQGQLHEDVTLFLAEQKDSHDAAELASHETIDGDHGRIETRRYGITDEISWLKERHDWAGLRSKGQCPGKFYYYQTYSPEFVAEGKGFQEKHELKTKACRMEQ
jgi:hypothetical protein